MPTSDRLQSFGVTIFTEMSDLARKHGAINLGQGFPDWDGAEFVKEAAARATLAGGHDQYPPSPGIPELRSALAEHYSPLLGKRLDPETEITVTSGCTEALAAAALGLINPGDEVILIEPYYDAYPADVAMAGGVLRHVTLRPPEFTLDIGELQEAITPATKAVFFNNPHNPTGRVFTEAEVAGLARLCVENDVIAISDEVYEEMTYDGAGHRRLATFDGMWERTLTLSSLGKTFSLTGWKVGWAIGPPDLTNSLRAAHQFLTFTTPTPVQHGAVAALEAPPSFYQAMRDSYQNKRDLLAAGLADSGFEVHLPQGTYFLMADHPGEGDDREFCFDLIERAGVVAIPPSVFYSHPADGASLIRFAFCKEEDTLREALERIAAF